MILHTRICPGCFIRFAECGAVQSAGADRKMGIAMGCAQPEKNFETPM